MQADEAVVATGQPHPLAGARPDELGQRQRQHGQVHPAHARQHQRKHGRHAQRQRHAAQQRRQQTPAPLQMRQCCAVGPQRKKRRMAKTDQPAQSHHHLQAQAQQQHDQQVFGEAAAVLPLPQRPQQQRRHGQQHGPARAPGRRTREHWHRLALRHGQRRAAQALRAKHQHHRHRQKHQHQRGLRHQRHAQGVDHADQHGGGKRPAHAAQAAGDHHHKSLDHHAHVHLQIGGFAWQLQRPGQPGQCAAEHDHAQHERRGVHTQRGQHLAVLRGGFDLFAPQRAREDQVQSPPDQRPQGQGEKLPGGQISLAQHE